MKKIIEKNYLLIIIAVLGFMTVVSILNANNDSLIYDEDAHIPAGYSYLTQQDIRLNPEHPPLLKDLAAFPLLFINPKLDTTQDFWTKDNADDGQWNAGKSFLFGGDNNPDQIIFWSRLPIVFLSSETDTKKQFSASGVLRASNAGQPCTPAMEQAIAHHAAHADHQRHDGNEKELVKQSPATCWNMCVAAVTGILATPLDVADLTVSSVVYSADSQRLYGHMVLLDPGIPKHFD